MSKSIRFSGHITRTITYRYWDDIEVPDDIDHSDQEALNEYWESNVYPSIDYSNHKTIDEQSEKEINPEL